MELVEHMNLRHLQLLVPDSSEHLEAASDAEFKSDRLYSNHGISCLFLKCHLIERILEAWEMNEKKQGEGGRRYGYMGHLTRIANCIVHSTDKGPNCTLVQQLIK
ncbi:Serine/threonine-protein phosphatase 6 regulatory subunit 3, partial [Varanus komodoensis]